MTALLPRIGHACLAALLLLMAGLQWNDPDPLRWIVIYATAGLLFLLAAANRRVPRSVLGPLLLIVVGYAGYTGVLYFGGFAATPMADGAPPERLPWWRIEEPREMVGLLGTGALLVTLWPRGSPSRRSN